MNLQHDNRWIVPMLNDFLYVLPKNHRYFLLGSVALVSYTKRLGYQRAIKDIDVICDESGFERVIEGLKKKGYTQATFITKAFPFYRKLSKLAVTKYYRFVKDGKSLEIMTTDFGNDDGMLSVELYPGAAFCIPAEAIQTTRIDGVSFQAVTPELLLLVYRFGSRTWGRLVRKNHARRNEDIKELSRVVDSAGLDAIARTISFQLGHFSMRIPVFLLR